MQTEGLGHLCAFDDDFDVADDIYRLDTATNPYDLTYHPRLGFLQYYVDVTVVLYV